ncbi:hypothetical protein HanHA300_Chr04g0128571 [Helianthus annuus]|nr:hypothetical protein HanHA300_Chr04g0128571 [Helianthus annuus]KAJ0596329.1 hypothetical protein HanHA89_Chr04g0141541 [Helianthus annuus]
MIFNGFDLCLSIIVPCFNHITDHLHMHIVSGICRLLLKLEIGLGMKPYLLCKFCISRWRSRVLHHSSHHSFDLIN